MSAITPITSGNTLSSNSAATAARVPQKTLGQNDFLKLLATQMSSQDPMNPQKDTEFIAQMAQFSALESASTTQAQQSVLQANLLIGRTVALQQDDGSVVTGAVSNVQIEAGTPKIVVNGTGYELKQLTLISPTPTAN